MPNLRGGSRATFHSYDRCDLAATNCEAQLTHVMNNPSPAPAVRWFRRG